MNRKIKTAVLSAMSLVLIAVWTGSCEHAFPNDDLDFYWRLQTIEYASGQTSQVEDDIMFGFARHMVMIENTTSGRHFQFHGVTVDTGDSLKLDFSMYPPSDTAAIMAGLRKCGIDSLVTTFGVEYPKGRLVLTGSKAVLKLKKW